MGIPSEGVVPMDESLIDESNANRVSTLASNSLVLNQ